MDKVAGGICNTNYTAIHTNILEKPIHWTQNNLVVDYGLLMMFIFMPQLSSAYNVLLLFKKKGITLSN